MSPKKSPIKNSTKQGKRSSSSSSKKMVRGKVASKLSSKKKTSGRSGATRNPPKAKRLPSKAAKRTKSASKVVAKKPAKKASTFNGATRKPTTKKSLSGVRATQPVAKKVRTLGKNATSASVKTKPKTASRMENERFRQMLLSIRRRLLGDVNMMSQEALGGIDSASGDNHAPIHPAEIGTHSFEQEFTLNLLSSDRDRLARIEAALEKIADGTYGTCDECNGRIPKARLEVIPDTPYCVKCASQLEG